MMMMKRQYFFSPPTRSDRNVIKAELSFTSRVRALACESCYEMEIGLIIYQLDCCHHHHYHHHHHDQYHTMTNLSSTSVKKIYHNSLCNGRMKEKIMSLTIFHAHTHVLLSWFVLLFVLCTLFTLYSGKKEKIEKKILSDRKKKYH